MANARNRRFEYVIDMEHTKDSYGVWNMRSFRDRNTALAYAESLAFNNPDISISVMLVPLEEPKNILRTS